MAEQNKEPARAPISIQHQREGLRRGVPPMRVNLHRGRALVPAGDRLDGPPPLLGGPLDGQRLRPTGKKRFPHHRIVDEIQHVRGERHNSVAGASRDSPCSCLHAARRYCRYRSGLAPRRYPDMDSRTASCTTNPSRQASTKGRSSILRSNASGSTGRSTVPGSIATSKGPVTRRTTDAASSARRVSGSSTSSRNTRVRVFTTRVSAAFSSDNSGCSVTPAAARTSASGCPRAIRARRSIAAG